VRHVWGVCLTIGALALVADGTGAQAPSAGNAGRAGATRSELERLAARAESPASVDSATAPSREQSRRDAAALRERLRDGDFRPGDNIVLAVPADSALSDTFVVRAGGPAGPVLRLPNLPEMSLRGVLRSELQAHLVANVGRFLKDTVMRTTVLIPIGVLGELARPGYYRVPIDAPFSDVIMAAGGPTPTADLTRITVRRVSREFLSRGAARAAMVKGLTLDELALAPGDEVIVGVRRERRRLTALETVSMASTLLMGVYTTGLLGHR
jgi:protein involved in polysaccharide export with SLBB domain